MTFKPEEVEYQMDLIKMNKTDTSQKIAIDLWIYFNNRKRDASTIRKKMTVLKKWQQGHERKYDQKIGLNGEIEFMLQSP